MLTSTEYFLSKALRESIITVKNFMDENKISSADKARRIKKAFEKRDVIEGYFAKITNIVSLFDDAVLEKENLPHILKLKEAIIKLSKVKEYDPETVVKKLEVVEKTNGDVLEELKDVILKRDIKEETESMVSFVVADETLDKLVSKTRSKKLLTLEGMPSLIIQDELNTKGAKIFSVDKKEFQEKFQISDEQLKKRKLIRELREQFMRKHEVYFSASKLGLTPIFEADFLRDRKPDEHGDYKIENKEFLYYHKKVDGMERLRYYNIMDLLKHNYVPINIVKKQVKARPSIIAYSNGWFNSGLTTEDKIKRAIKSDLQWDDPEKVKEYNEKWKAVYKGGKKRKSK